MKQLAAVCSLVLGLCLVRDAAADSVALQRQLTALAQATNGHIGIAVADGGRLATVNGDVRFPLQSVMKLIVSAAVLNKVDQKKFHLDDKIVVMRSNFSVYAQPIAPLVTAKGFRTTLLDLIRRAIIESDGTAADILFAKAGGSEGIHEFLAKHALAGIRVDRDERQLQIDVLGLRWEREFVDPALFQAAIARASKATRDAAWKRYLSDPRDTATPKGMLAFLARLSDGKLLSKESSSLLFGIMQETKTGPDRLKAGLSAGWGIAHKTGSSNTWSGVTATTNDVGILIAPDGTRIPLCVFLGESSASSEKRAATIASVARLVIANHGKS